MMAQGAGPEGAANSKLRRLLARNKSFNCTDEAIGGFVLYFKTVSRRSRPHWRGLAEILDIDETGAAVKIESQTF